MLDMIAHNNDRSRDVFQICPGRAANRWAWHSQDTWPRDLERTDAGMEPRRPAARRQRGRGSAMPMPNVTGDRRIPFLNGEVRPSYDPRSTLYNTDGQIFSDAGVPVVLFMENYDINRTGYHDTHDTMANIDLDYGAAVAAIAIESVARAASEPTTTKAQRLMNSITVRG